MATITLNGWVNNNGSAYSAGETINISFHNTSTRALVLLSSGVTLASGGNLTVTNAALVSGTTYCWFAESPTQTTWFASGRVTAA